MRGVLFLAVAQERGLQFGRGARPPSEDFECAAHRQPATTAFPDCGPGVGFQPRALVQSMLDHELEWDHVKRFLAIDRDGDDAVPAAGDGGDDRHGGGPLRGRLPPALVPWA